MSKQTSKKTPETTASTLIKSALTATRSEGKRIVPICPFVAGYLKKHDDEFANITDKVTPAHLQAVKNFNG